MNNVLQKRSTQPICVLEFIVVEEESCCIFNGLVLGHVRSAVLYLVIVLGSKTVRLQKITINKYSKVSTYLKSFFIIRMPCWLQLFVR